jgi:hypothetical protein
MTNQHQSPPRLAAAILNRLADRGDARFVPGWLVSIRKALE